MKHKPYGRLKDALREQGVTYRKLGLLLGISVAAVNNKINGKSDFYLDETTRIEAAYRIPLDVFLPE